MTPDLFRRYLRFALHFVPRREDAEDLLVEAYLAVCQYTDESHPRFVQRFCGMIRRLGKKSAFQRACWDHYHEAPLGEGHAVYHIEAAVLVRVDTARALLQLSDLQRETLILFVTGHAMKEIADHHGTRHQTVNTRMQEARNKMRRWTQA